MTLPASGAIAMSQVATELGMAAGGINLNNATVRSWAGAAGTGAVSMSGLRGKSNAPTVTIARQSTFSSTWVITATGGVGPYTYFWRKVIDNAGCDAWANTPNSQTTTFGYSGSYPSYDSFRGEATGANGSMGYSATLVGIGPPDPNAGGSCFVAGSMVTMASGSLLPIEYVQVGDLVRGANGLVQVKGIITPLLRNRKLVAFDNGLCKTSYEHSMWSRDSYGNQWWATRSLDEWRHEAETGDGPHFNGHEPYDLTNRYDEYWDYAHLDGWRKHKTIVIPAPYETQLYHLLVDGSQSYFVDGYLVSSMADLDTFDWEHFNYE